MAELEEVTDQMALVKIGDEQFSILEIPSSKSMIVKKEIDRMLGFIDLDILVDDLGRVGNFVRIAYNGVAGYTDLQIKIRRIGYDVTKLCDKSAVTVSMYKRASTSILADLQGTYQFLLDRLEDMALETLAAVNDVAKDMAGAAEQLSKEFDEQSKKVESALEDTMNTKGREEENKKEIEKRRRELELSKEKSEKEVKEMEKELEQYEKRYQEAQRKQESAESSARNPFKQMVNAIFSVATAPFTRGQGGAQLFDTDSDMKVAENYRKEADSYHKDMKEQRYVRRKALGDIAEFAKSIENCISDKELAEAAIGALQNAMGGLKKLSALMLKVSLFWKQMQLHCETLAKDKMKRMVEAAMRKPEAERIRVWTNIGFKKAAMQYYSQWVALDDVCGTYMNKIKETQRTLYAYLEENPTTEEARRNVRQLAIAFRKDLEEAQKEIDKQNKNAEDAEAKQRANE